MPTLRRQAELDEIEQFIARRGATQCRPAFAGTVTNALAPDEEQRRIALIKVEEPWSQADAIEYHHQAV